MSDVVRAIAVERSGYVEVASNAPGRARAFFFPIRRWRVVGAERAIAIGRRVELELRRLGVRSPTVSVRIAS